MDIAGGAWCPKPQIDKHIYEYLEIDFINLHVITAVETQGRFGGGHGREYPSQYVLDYWRTDAKRWMQYKNRRGDRVRVFVFVIKIHFFFRIPNQF